MRFLRYFVNDGRLLNQSPLNDGFDLPSAFKDNFYRDQSLAGTLASVINPTLVNELRLQYARRSFDFPTVSTQPHLELSNTFTTGVNRGNPDFYRESRFEIVDNVTRTFNRHTVSFGGNFNLWTRRNPFRCSIPSRRTFPALVHFWEMMEVRRMAWAPSVFQLPEIPVGQGLPVASIPM